jgi:glycosyltransferase involved in cell wall biosynthesis
MISIIIPTYNAEKYISETIQSVLNQTYTDWELIVVDDGSTDYTAKIVKAFCEKEKRINYFYKENSGVSDTRNFGMGKAKGNYFALLDADDVWGKENLHEKIEILKKKKNTDWIFSDLVEFEEDKKESVKKIQKTDNCLESLLKWDGRVLTAPSGLLFRRKAYEEGVKFDNKFSTAADQDFVIQLASKYKGYHISKALWRYRILENSMSRNILVMEKDHIGVFKKALKNKLFKNFCFKQRCFSNLYWILAGSWWKDGKNKTRGMYFVLRALLTNPFSFVKIFKK